jgi:PAS domain-containing protein
MPIPATDIIRNISEGYVEVDAALRVTDLNGNAETLLRRDRQQVIGETLPNVIPDARQSQHWRAVEEAVQRGKNETIAAFFPAQYRWWDIRVVPLADGGAGLLIRDVTDRQWLIRREAERVYLKNVFEDAPVAITVMRGKGLVIEYANAFAQKIIGPRRIVGLPIRDALRELEQRELFDLLDRVYTTGEPFHGRDLFVQFDRNGDGDLEEGYFDVSYQAIRDFDGTVSGVLSLSVDVTDCTRDRRVRL